MPAKKKTQRLPNFTAGWISTVLGGTDPPSSICPNFHSIPNSQFPIRCSSSLHYDRDGVWWLIERRWRWFPFLSRQSCICLASCASCASSMASTLPTFLSPRSRAISTIPGISRSRSICVIWRNLGFLWCYCSFRLWIWVFQASFFIIIIFCPNNSTMDFINDKSAKN